MTFQSRSILDQELAKVRDNILRLTSMVDTAIDQAMTALRARDTSLAQKVIASDIDINHLRYEIEEECLRILATQAPTATDLRTVVAAIHVAVELERMGDYASGIARLVARMEEEAEIDTLHKLPKMAKRARQMVQESIKAYVDRDAELAHVLIKQDDKIDKQYNKLFRETLEEMQDDDYIRRATFLLWAGHNLERIGDRATNIAERVIFMLTGEYVEITADVD
jgi:phosphate transport system protein